LRSQEDGKTGRFSGKTILPVFPPSC